MRNSSAASDTAVPVRIRFVVLLNIAVFATAFHTVEFTIPEEEPKVDEVTPPPKEVIPEIIPTKPLPTVVYSTAKGWTLRSSAEVAGSTLGPPSDAPLSISLC